MKTRTNYKMSMFFGRYSIHSGNNKNKEHMIRFKKYSERSYSIDR
ncbi:hypothetical protein [uncultured Croceitalea sp.]